MALFHGGGGAKVGGILAAGKRDGHPIPVVFNLSTWHARHGTLAAWQARLHTRQAIVTLAEALTLAERGGFVRLLADEGAPMALLLAQVRQRGAEGARASVSAAYLDRLLEVCAATAGTSVPIADTPTPHNLDALSTREQEVLRLLADGLSNAEIAERLVVTPGTVKRHLHNLYSKLGVENRTQAAAFARTHAPPTTE
jgi:LuxR family maltose regulon positive regulatory protein